MNPELKAKWVAALRSGTYRQHRGKLRSPDRTEHCCLGVLCEVAGLKISDNGKMAISSSATMFNGYEPIERLIGRYDGSCGQLMGHNDTGWKFPNIATWIEENL